MAQKILGKILSMYRQPSMSVEDVANKLHKNIEDIKQCGSEMVQDLHRRWSGAFFFNNI